MDLVQVDPFDNVVATGLATTKYRPVGAQSIFGFILQLGGTFTAGTHITGTGVRVRAPGGKELFPGITGARLVDINEYDGLVDDVAYLPILFGDPTARTIQGKHLGNFDTTVYPGDITIEVNIASATSPTLDAFALITPPKQLMGLGFGPVQAAQHRALIETVLTISASVTRQSQSIGVGSSAGALLKKIMMFDGSTTITDIDVKKEGLSIYEDVPIALNSYIQDDMEQRRPQTGLIVYDRLVGLDYSEAGTTVKQNGRPFNWQFRLTTSGSTTITAYADVIATLPLL